MAYRGSHLRHSADTDWDSSYTPKFKFGKSELRLQLRNIYVSTLHLLRVYYSIVLFQLWYSLSEAHVNYTLVVFPFHLIYFQRVDQVGWYKKSPNWCIQYYFRYFSSDLPIQRYFGDACLRDKRDVQDVRTSLMLWGSYRCHPLRLAYVIDLR